VHHSLLFSNVKINSYTTVEDSVVLPDTDINCHCKIKKAIIDRGCRIPAGSVIGGDAGRDAKRYYVSQNGVVLVTPEMLGQDLHYVR